MSPREEGLPEPTISPDVEITDASQEEAAEVMAVVHSNNEDEVKARTKEGGIIGRLSSANRGEIEKQAYLDLMATLSPEQIKTYEKMGFHFQLLRAVCQNLGEIALAGGETSLQKFSTVSEILPMVRDLEKMAREFAKPQNTRTSNGNIDIHSALYPEYSKFYNAYQNLRTFTVTQEKLHSLEVTNDYSIHTVPSFDGEFMDLIESLMPADAMTLINGGDGSNQTISREAQREALENMSKALRLDNEEKDKFIQALKVIIRTRKKVHLGTKPEDDFDDTSHVRIEDLKEILEALSKLDCIKRRLPSNPGNEAATAENNLLGLHEINRLVMFIRSWEETFRWMEKMNVGKGKLGQLISPDAKKDGNEEVSEEERERAHEDKLAKKYNVIRSFTDAFNAIFPDPVAPMVVGHHRRVLRDRIKQYAVLGNKVNEIKNKELRTDLKKVLHQISIILSYLDYMWDMMEVEENSAGKHIVYPKKMLLMGRMIIREIEALEGKLNIYGSKYKNPTPAAGQEMGDDFFGFSDEPEFENQAGLGVPFNEDSQNFKLEQNSVVKAAEETQEKVKETIDILSDEDKKLQEQVWKLGDEMFGLSEGLSLSRMGRLATFKATQVKTVLTNDEAPIAEEVEHPTETLSYDIHDFITDELDNMRQILYRIALAFDENLSRSKVIPEIAEQEQQTNARRAQLAALGERLRPAMGLLAHAVDPRKNKINEEQTKYLEDNGMVESARTDIILLAYSIQNFHDRQEANLNSKKYHGVVRGAAYEKLVRLTNTVNDFMAEHTQKLDQKALDIYALRKRIDSFAHKTQIAVSEKKFAQTGLVKTWMDELDALKKIEDRILANGLNPEQIAKLHEKYTDKFMNVLVLTGRISQSKEIPEAAKVHFMGFRITNPYMDECIGEDFSPTYFKFYKLTNLMSDFMSVCDLQNDPNSPESQMMQ